MITSADEPTLPRDVCRCFDHGCPERNTCLRFTGCETGNTRVPSMFQFDTPLGSPCPLRIPVPADEPFHRTKKRKPQPPQP